MLFFGSYYFNLFRLLLACLKLRIMIFRNSKTIEVDNGLSVMEGAIQKDIPGIDADCGGSMACATCHVYVEDKWFDKIPSGGC